MLPLSGTDPMPLLIDAEAPLFDVHAKVALVPAITVAGEAVSVTVGGWMGLAAELPHPLNKAVANSKTTNNSNRNEVRS
jgi:hypothetical protein